MRLFRALWATGCVVVVSMLLCNSVFASGMSSLSAYHGVQQAPEEQAVIAVIKKLFDGMRARDTSSMRLLLHSSCRMQTAVVRNGKPDLELGSVQEWLARVAEPRPAVLDERILSYEVRIDGTLATVWSPYEFYIGDTFSHCGVDAFQLVKTEVGWQIIQVCDTRRKQGCKP
jgi:hypothetical protein